jgi:3-deoxy-D-manno-octulosonic-acid transferase
MAFCNPDATRPEKEIRAIDGQERAGGVKEEPNFMINTYDIAYWLGLGVSSPVWLARRAARHKVLGALRQRMGRVPPRGGQRAAVMIHAVSVGELNASRAIIDRLRTERPDLHIIISTTTQTGHERALDLYGTLAEAPAQREVLAVPPVKAEPAFTIIRYPLDFTPAIQRVLDHLRPSLVVLMELEVWPNFLWQCEKRGIGVVLLNGRVTEPSFRKYRMMGPVGKRMFGRLAQVCAQDEVYARRFAALGVSEHRLKVTGTMKFDTATVGDRIAGDAQLADELGLHPTIIPGGAGERIWVCGSTGPGEEEMILRQYRSLLARHARLRLVIVPRKPERFAEVGETIIRAGFELLCRSQTIRPKSEGLAKLIENAPPPCGQQPDAATTLLPRVVLGDTMGELRKFYSLADVVFVGRTLVDLGPKQHGSDMIEPAALGKPVIVGPYTGNFAEAMNRFREAEAILEAHSEEDLGLAVSVLLSSPERAHEMGRRAREVVVKDKGATERNLEVVLGRLPGGSRV